MKNIKKKLFLINEFVDNSRNFWNDHKIKNLDSKHKKVLKKFSLKYKKNIKLFSDEIIDWEGQTNLGAPFQFSYERIKNSSFKQNLKTLRIAWPGRENAPTLCGSHLHPILAS